MKTRSFFNPFHLVLAFGLVVVVFLMLPAKPAYAAACVWQGGGADTNWTTVANWNTCDGSYPGNGTPDTANINTTSNAIVIDANVTVDALTIGSGFTGSVTKSAAVNLNVYGPFSQASGTFSASGASVVVTGNFELSGGTFSVAGGLMTVDDGAGHTNTFTISGGTFNQNAPLQLSSMAISSGTFDGGGSAFYVIGNYYQTGGTFLQPTFNGANCGKIPGHDPMAHPCTTIGGNLTIDNGTFQQEAYPMYVNGNFVQNGGTFTGSDIAYAPYDNFYNYWVHGDFSISGGSFTAFRSLINIDGQFNLSGGTYYNGGNASIYNDKKLYLFVNGPATISGSGSFRQNTLYPDTGYVLFQNNLTQTGGTFNHDATDISIRGIYALSGGTFTQNNNPLHIYNGFTQTGGNFNGSNTATTNLYVYGQFSLSTGATFTSTAGTFLVAGGFSHTGGIFRHNNGKVTLSNSGSYPLNISGGTIFYNLDITDGLIGYWNFEEGSGTTVADLSGMGNTGTLVNGPLFSTNDPLTYHSYSMAFNGTNQYINTANESTYDLRKGFSFSFWVYLGPSFYSGTDNTGILSKGTSSCDTGNPCTWGITRSGVSTTELAFVTYVNQGRRAIPFPVTAGTWHHIAGVFTHDGTDYIKWVYIDATNGIPHSTPGHPFGVVDTNDLPLRIGGDPGNLTYFDGMLDDVRIYNRVLSVDEIKALARGNYPGPAVVTTTLTTNITVTNNLINQGGNVINFGSNTAVVTGTVTNTGIFRQVKPVTAVGTPVSFLQLADFSGSPIAYRGVEITPTVSNLGTVTVDIRGVNSTGGEYCTTSATRNYALRCFTLTAQNPNNQAQVRLYALNSEMSGISLANTRVFRYVYLAQTWNLLPTGTAASVDTYTYAEAATPGFSSFLIGDGNNNPTAISLSDFASRPQGVWLPLFALLALVMLSAGVFIQRQRQKVVSKG